MGSDRKLKEFFLMNEWVNLTLIQETVGSIPTSGMGVYLMWVLCFVR